MEKVTHFITGMDRGAWQTIRCARKQGRKIMIIHPKTLEITREQEQNTQSA